MIFACETDGFVEKLVFSTKVGLFSALICQNRPKGAFLRKCGLVWQLWLELIFNVLLNNITHGRTHGRTHDIASPCVDVELTYLMQ